MGAEIRVRKTNDDKLRIYVGDAVVYEEEVGSMVSPMTTKFRVDDVVGSMTVRLNRVAAA